MARRLGKTLSWFFGGAVALSLIAYAVLLAANLDDRPPIAEISVLRALQDSRSPVVSDNNSYLFMLGVAGHPDADPLVLGSERHEWMESARPGFDWEDDPLSDDYDFRALRSDAVANLAQSCSHSEADCLRLLETEEEAVAQWLADELWLLKRYRSVINMTEFSEAIPFEALAPLPSYGVIFEAQRLHIADAWKLATEADAAAVNAALNRDLTYWRMVLRNSDVLITKMIATAAIIRHFKLGNLVLRRLPQEVAADGIPTSWRVQISDEERSMKRSLAGEWTFFDGSTKKIVADSENSFGNWMGLTDSTTLDRVTWVLLKPFWQPQDLSNRHARLMLDLGNAFDVPYDEIPRAVELADGLQKSAYRPFSKLYNIAGDIVMAANFWSFSDYAVRVSDLEGIRRAALLTADLRASGTTKEVIVQRILASATVDPYTGEPLTWIDGEDAILFHGLEPHEERSQHKLKY